MNRIIRAYIVIPVMLLLASCGGQKVVRELVDIESYINDRPDSALVAIRQIDTTALRTKAQKAKFALLHAMALDKNYIDTADTRIIQPAVDYYERHGSPEDRLKAWMYMGIEQYNGGLLNHAIESFYNAAEEAARIEDVNLQGILYSRIAVTYMRTRDYPHASDYLDKAIDSFRLCGRKDNEHTILINKIRNLVQLRKWEEAQAIASEAVSDDTIDKRKKAIIKMDYATLLLYTNLDKDNLALQLFSEAFSEGNCNTDQEELCAYAFALGANGFKDKSDSVFSYAKSSLDDSGYSYYYWNHRLKLKQKDYKGAYEDLKKSMWINDSLLNAYYSASVANSSRSFLENISREKNLKLRSQRYLSFIISLVCLVLALTLCVLWLITKRRKKERAEDRMKMEMVIESLKDRLLEQGKQVVNGRAKFSLLADVYDEIYGHYRDGDDVEERLLSALRSRIGNLRSDPDAQRRFEKMLDEESKGMISSFRKDYPSLSEKEYRMASYYFAGFDNTTVMLILDISNLEYTRVKKNRLKQKILASLCERQEQYASFF